MSHRPPSKSSEAAAAQGCNHRLEHSVHTLRRRAGRTGRQDGSSQAELPFGEPTALCLLAICCNAAIWTWLPQRSTLTSFHRRTAHARVVAPSHGSSACKRNRSKCGHISIGRCGSANRHMSLEFCSAAATLRLQAAHCDSRTSSATAGGSRAHRWRRLHALRCLVAWQLRRCLLHHVHHMALQHRDQGSDENQQSRSV